MKLYNPLLIADNPPIYSDCFVILSYAVENKHLPTAPTRALIEEAYKLRKKFPKSFVIMSTGDNQRLGVPNSRVMAEYGVKIGIPPKWIIEESKSMNTYENLLFSRQITNQKKFKKITLITYEYHTKRTLEVAKKIGWQGLSWISVSAPGSPAYGWKYIQTYSRFNILIYEIGAYLYNWLRDEL